MRFSFNFLNLEVGFFFRKRYSINGFLKKIEYNELNNYNNIDNIKNKWEYNATIEKRLNVLTGSNKDKGMLHWLYRDVDRAAIAGSWSYDEDLETYKYTPEFSLEPIYAAFTVTDNWKNKLIKSGATKEQIDFYNKTSSKLFIISLNRIREEYEVLFDFINNHFSEDQRYSEMILGEEI